MEETWDLRQTTWKKSLEKLGIRLRLSNIENSTQNALNETDGLNEQEILEILKTNLRNSLKKNKSKKFFELN